MREDVRAHHRLPGQDRLPRRARHHLGQAAQLRGVDAEVDVVELAQRQDHLREVRHSGTFADPVHAHVEVPHTGFETGERVGDREAEVVVAVGLQVDVRRLRDRAHALGVLAGVEDADGVGQPQPVGTGFADAAGVLLQEGQVGAAHVLGADRDEAALVLGELHHVRGRGQQPAAVLLDAVLEVDVRRRQSDVDSLEAERDGVPHVVEDPAVPADEVDLVPAFQHLLHRQDVVPAHGRDARLQPADTGVDQRGEDGDLRLPGEGETGGLLAVAQRGVFEDDVVTHVRTPSRDSRGGRCFQRPVRTRDRA